MIFREEEGEKREKRRGTARSVVFSTPSPLEPGFPAQHATEPDLLLTQTHAHPHQHPSTMATWTSFTTIDDALTHNLTLALLGLEHGHLPSDNRLVPRYIGLREVLGVQPPDTVLGVCARGDAACPGHRLPLSSSQQALACCVDCGALVGSSQYHEAGAVFGCSTPAGWVCGGTHRGGAPPAPVLGDPSRPRFGAFDDVVAASADERVREALGLGVSKKPCARWVGLRYEAQPDGSRRVVGVCHAHNTPSGCPGHAPALRHLSDSTACCLESGVATTSKCRGSRVQAASNLATLCWTRTAMSRGGWGLCVASPSTVTTPGAAVCVCVSGVSRHVFLCVRPKITLSLPLSPQRRAHSTTRHTHPSHRVCCCWRPVAEHAPVRARASCDLHLRLPRPFSPPWTTTWTPCWTWRPNWTMPAGTMATAVRREGGGRASTGLSACRLISARRPAALLRRLTSYTHTHTGTTNITRKRPLGSVDVNVAGAWEVERKEGRGNNRKACARAARGPPPAAPSFSHLPRAHTNHATPHSIHAARRGQARPRADASC